MHRHRMVCTYDEVAPLSAAFNPESPPSVLVMPPTNLYKSPNPPEGRFLVHLQLFHSL